MPISSAPHSHADRVIHRSLCRRLGIVLEAAYDLVLRPYQPLFIQQRNLQ